MPREQRTRITLLLPAPSTRDEILLVDKVLTQIVSAFDGATATSGSPPVIDGWWFDRRMGTSVHDANILIMADALLPVDDAFLSAYLDKLKLSCQREFGQDVIWLTVHPIYRINSDDGVK